MTLTYALGTEHGLYPGLAARQEDAEEYMATAAKAAEAVEGAAAVAKA